jgi:hypothetical protein
MALADDTEARVAASRALSAHKRGDDATCLRVLDGAPEVPAGSKWARELLYNRALCGGECNTMAADGCLEGKTKRAEELAARDTGYTTPACPIPGHGKALAVLPSFGLSIATCVELVRPAGPLPSLRVIDLFQGTGAQETTVEFPDGMITSPSDACNFALAGVMTSSGVTRLRLSGRGRDCDGGTALWIYDEIFRLDGYKLVFDHANDVGLH